MDERRDNLKERETVTCFKPKNTEVDDKIKTKNPGTLPLEVEEKVHCRTYMDFRRVKVNEVDKEYRVYNSEK